MVIQYYRFITFSTIRGYIILYIIDTIIYLVIFVMNMARVLKQMILFLYKNLIYIHKSVSRHSHSK